VYPTIQNCLVLVLNSQILVCIGTPIDRMFVGDLVFVLNLMKVVAISYGSAKSLLLPASVQYRSHNQYVSYIVHIYILVILLMIPQLLRPYVCKPGVHVLPSQIPLKFTNYFYSISIGKTKWKVPMKMLWNVISWYFMVFCGIS